jgi:hypothetical protein
MKKVKSPRKKERKKGAKKKKKKKSSAVTCLNLAERADDIAHSHAQRIDA